MWLSKDSGCEAAACCDLLGELINMNWNGPLKPEEPEIMYMLRKSAEC